jgi:hypothetical protein
MLPPKIKLRRLLKPMVYLANIRYAYVKMMLNLENFRVFPSDLVDGKFNPPYDIGVGNRFGEQLLEYDENIFI